MLSANVSVLGNASLLDALAFDVDVTVVAVEALVLADVSVIAIVADTLTCHATVPVIRTEDIPVLARLARLRYAKETNLGSTHIAEARAFVAIWREPIASSKATTLDKNAVVALRHTLCRDAAISAPDCNVRAILAVLAGGHLVTPAVGLIVLIIDTVTIVTANAVVDHAERVYAVIPEINVSIHAFAGVALPLLGAGSVAPADVSCARIGAASGIAPEFCQSIVHLARARALHTCAMTVADCVLKNACFWVANAAYVDLAIRAGYSQGKAQKGCG